MFGRMQEIDAETVACGGGKLAAMGVLAIVGDRLPGWLARAPVYKRLPN